MTHATPRPTAVSRFKSVSSLPLPPGWRTELVWLLAVAVVAGAGTLFTEHPWAVLSLSLAAYGMRHLVNLVRLSQHLSGKEGMGPPYPHGTWGEVFEQARRLRAGSRKRKRRLSRFLTRFREAVTAMPDAVLILGRGNEVEWANPATETLLGVSWPQVSGQPLTSAVDSPILGEYLSDGDYRRALEFASPANQTIVLSLHVTAFGKKHQRLVVARDITRIYHLDQARRDFVSNVSHELRTPLTVITGFLEGLLDEPQDCPQWARSMVLMQQQAGRMQNIIDDLLTLSRLEMQPEDIEGSPVPVPDMLPAIVEEARRLSGEAKHDLHLEADPSVWLRGNLQELRSAFSNLIFNAVRHTPRRTQIRITWGADEHGAYYSVADSGEGIAPRHIPRLTERFYRVDSGRSRASGGTGLGLAIVKHTLNRYGGELEIESEMGRGSTFTCRFSPERVLSPPRSLDDPANP